MSQPTRAEAQAHCSAATLENRMAIRDQQVEGAKLNRHAVETLNMMAETQVFAKKLTKGTASDIREGPWSPEIITGHLGKTYTLYVIHTGYVWPRIHFHQHITNGLTHYIFHCSVAVQCIR